MKERIQKILSSYGFGSRRNIEKKICRGLIKINGKSVSLGQSFVKNNIQYISLNNKKFFLKKDTTKIVIYNKPIGEICTKKDTSNRITVFNKLPKLYNSSWISIGRLDINTSGLLLFTNYGELAYRLMHPRYMIKREYLVRVYGKISNKKILILKNGIKIGNSISKFLDIVCQNNKNKNQWFKVSLLQGKKNEVRLLWNSVGIQVNRLIRISYGVIKLPKNLKTGNFIALNSININNIFNSVNLKSI
ncbi:Ribosomal large subunit pseudouridine synthase B [Buchnera aphidicola (Cinara kochiana kochiana)]|uniref:Pseudouridine synthase n=1 Tax=Buchnera aphidicola (Cinara kochiana kochiana) TaxID=2518976 RepID=A0A451D5H5_9GAMM|nr:pseudouridine synthase [Buchnera aphidicola]VFP81099.1 Ribosomal large subunit pseudouridine synthase B [Buchnera aphidicola (Cinara kochiana kochiana)]